MGVLNRREIERRLDSGELIRNARRKERGQFDVQNDSYDLAAGTAVWKNPTINGKKGDVETRCYLREPLGVAQPTVTVQPGQMIFIVTLEDIVMPSNLCGTVYSRNSLALGGILALNAGHVDPEYEGPIVIRLINLRATSWTLTLGYPIFTIIFQTVDSKPNDPPCERRAESQGDMILRVIKTADEALSNALFELYEVDVDKRLNEYKNTALAEFIELRDDRWVRREEIWLVLLSSWWKISLAAVLFVSTVAAGIAGIIYVLDKVGIL